MEHQQLIDRTLTFFENSPDNLVPEEDAIRPDLAGMRIYDTPIFGIAAASDCIFREFLNDKVIGREFLLPEKWLPDAQSVISFFVPFTEQVKVSNRQQNSKPSDEWLHARIEGQIMLNKLADYIAEQLKEDGFTAVIPATDPHFRMIKSYASNWSERHVAYACGLGTFGLSRGLITRKGVAGRFGSVVTSAPLPVTKREYDDPFAYCTMCGRCQQNCPVNAIDITRGIIDGKDQTTCELFLNSTNLPPHGLHQRKRYGCGKCQVSVPCESQIPSKAIIV